MLDPAKVETLNGTELAVMVAAVLGVRSALPVMPAPLILAVLVGVGAAAYFAALLVLARETVSEIVALVTRREIAPA